MLKRFLFLLFIAVSLFGLFSISAFAINCGNTITTNTNLTGDLTPCSGSGLIIGADNITLNCMNYMINGTRDNASATGVVITSRMNVTIINCTVQNFWKGISVTSTSNSTIENNIVRDNIDPAIDLWSSPNNTIINNTIYNSATGILLRSNSDDSIVHSNTIYNESNFGVYIDNSYNNNITNITAYDNYFGPAFYLLSGASGNMIANSTAYNNEEGFTFQGSSNNNLIDNIAQNNSLWAVDLSGGSLNNIFTNLDIGSAIISFDARDITLINATSPSSAPLQNISKYINATSAGAGSWLYLNVSYTHGEIAGIIESTLRMAKNNGSWYTNPAAFANTYGVNTVSNYVYANITNFGSIFAPLGTLSTAIDLTVCQDIITSGSYDILTDMTGNQSSGVCFYVLADNVTLDCGNRNINGTDAGTTYGIFSNNLNTTIQNCNIYNYTYGIYFNNSNHSVLFNNTVSTSGDTGIRLVNSSFDNLTNNIIDSNYYGIYLYDNCNNNTLYNNELAFNSAYAISLYTNASNNTLDSNYVHDNNDICIYIYNNSENNTFTNNTVRNSLLGFKLENGSDGNILFNNSANSNTYYGIYIIMSQENNITNNTANNNKYDAIRLAAASNNNIINNFINHSLEYGILLLNSSMNNFLINNTVNYNVYGIFLYTGSQYTVISGNTIDHNTNFGIYLHNTDCTNNNIIYNTANNNGGDGIFVNILASNNNIEYNTANNNIQYGIGIGSNSNNTVANNNVDNNSVANIYAVAVNDLTIKNNNMTNGGWCLYGSQFTNGIISSNIANNCNTGFNIGSDVFNITIDKNNFTNLAGGYGIHTAINATYYNITNNYFSNINGRAIHLDTGSEYFNIINNTMDNISGFEALEIDSNSNNNVLMNNTMSSIGNWDLVVGGTNNTFTNMTINQTKFSFIYSGLLYIFYDDGVSYPDPLGYKNISHYLNAENQSSNSWVYLNMSYNDPTDLGTINESTLKIARNNGTWETNTSIFANVFGVDTINNYVYANITSFGSTFAPLGTSSIVFPQWSANQTSIAVNYSLTQSVFNITWADDVAVNTVYLESNYTGNATNYTMIDLVGGVYGYNATLPAGTFYWKSYANDTSNNWNESDTWEFTINKAPTTMTLTFDGNGSNKTYQAGNTAIIFANLSIGGKTVYLNSTLPTFMNISGNTPITYTKLLNNVGIYPITALFLGDANYTTSSQTWYLTVMDNITPTITIYSPQNATYVTNNIGIDYLATDNSLVDSCWYSIDGGANVTLTNCTNSSHYYVDGNYNLTIYANDTSGNLNSSIVYFTVDASLSNYVGRTDVVITCSYCNGSTYVYTGSICPDLNCGGLNVITPSELVNVPSSQLGLGILLLIIMIILLLSYGLKKSKKR